MGNFENGIALITGAGSGIGEACAYQLAEGGAKVILVGRTESKLTSVANKINEQVKETRAYTYSCDVTDPASVDRLAEQVKKDFRYVSLLVNNAGASSNSFVQTTTVEQWQQMIEVNLNSVFYVSQAIGKLMIDHSAENEELNRSIVNVASLSGHKAGANFPHYSAAKAAIINFTKALAYEYSRSNIRVNSVSPGFIETPLTASSTANEKFMKMVERKTTMGRVGTPDEIANIITFLLSDKASYVTGADLLADGGFILT